MKTIRCAIYTRKSSDEGLEQDFNSLDAQRKACAAYVLSQASEGWKLLPQFYDDGGLSGGTLERPALQRLLADVAQGRIDIIVVYKVDRLTRSLLDFAKLVEAFDEAGTSFVSVTQSFNTTTSMGRLTLNMLLSFAQFEREVTAERIRDKIAASKAKGMWMGGTPPIGYKPDGRSLAIVEDQAALVRDIYARYREAGNVRHVAEALETEGIRSPRRVTGNGRKFGGCLFSRGQIYQILKNPIYAGKIRHGDKTYPGNQPAIIEPELWEAVQRQLAEHVKGERSRREANTSLLAGILFDTGGELLIPVHTTKAVPGCTTNGKVRYRYYVRKSDQHGTAAHASPALRIPASEIEQVVCQELSGLFDDPLKLLNRCGIPLDPAMLNDIMKRGGELQDRLRGAPRTLLRKLVSQITVHSDRIALALRPAAIAELLGTGPVSDELPELEHQAHVRLTRTGLAVRLIQDDGKRAAGSTPDPTLVRLLIRARVWWSELAKGDCTVTSIARREEVTPSYVTRIVRLVFLAPEVVEALLAGELLADVDGTTLLVTGAIAPCWREQAQRFLPGSSSPQSVLN